MGGNTASTNGDLSAAAHAGGANAPAPSVLIVARAANVGNAIAESLSSLGVSIHRHPSDAPVDIERFRELRPDVAFLDFDAAIGEGVPLYKAIGEAVSNCRFVLLCPRDRTAEAARLVRFREAFDYLLADGDLDPERIRLLIQQAIIDDHPAASEVRGFAKLRNQRVLELLGDIKSILKDDITSPIVRMIRDSSHDSAWSGSQPLSVDGVAVGYRGWLVDFICGKLRRLEREILLSGDQSEPEESSAETILIAEDDPVSAELAQGLLERNGYDVVIATTNDEAIRHLSRRPPSLVLMDVHLGTSDGLRIVKMMRARADLRVVPVIVVTADRQRDTLQEAMDAHVQGYLLKPYDPRELLDRVKAAILNAPHPA